MKIRKYNVLTLPFFSFFSKRAYRDVGENWRGLNLSYLFILLAICCLPPTFALRGQILQAIEQNQQHLIEQMPDIHISDGRVNIDQNQPYYITRRDGSTAVIIDTTGSMNYIEDPRVVALLMESSLIVRNMDNSFKTFDLSEVREFHLDRMMATSWLETAKETLAPLLYGLFLLLSFGTMFVLMLVGSVAGIILASFMEGSVSLAGSMRIAAAAATPSIIIVTISAVAGLEIQPLIYLAVTGIYFMAGIRACSVPMCGRMEKRIDLKSYLHDDVKEADGIQHAA